MVPVTPSNPCVAAIFAEAVQSDGRGSSWSSTTPRASPTSPPLVVYRAWELGLIVYYAGNWGNVLEITPPLILTRLEIEEGVDILRQAVHDVLAGKVSDDAVASFAGW